MRLVCVYVHRAASSGLYVSVSPRVNVVLLYSFVIKQFFQKKSLNYLLIEMERRPILSKNCVLLRSSICSSTCLRYLLHDDDQTHCHGRRYVHAARSVTPLL